jgi:hypothetical protein
MLTLRFAFSLGLFVIVLCATHCATDIATISNFIDFDEGRKR